MLLAFQSVGIRGKVPVAAVGGAYGARVVTLLAQLAPGAQRLVVACAASRRERRRRRRCPCSCWRPQRKVLGVAPARNFWPCCGGRGHGECVPPRPRA